MSGTKYYFGYQVSNGKAYPIKWTEYDGRIIGQSRSPKVKMEITEEEFLATNMETLMTRMHSPDPLK